MAEIEAACARLRAAGVSPDPMSIARREAHEDEWRDVWKQYFRALRVGRSFVIRPELGRARRRRRPIGSSTSIRGAPSAPAATRRRGW